MIVAEIMKEDVCTCAPTDTLEVPARIMWEHDCGSVPILDHDRHVVGMVTDRDICMTAYLRRQRLDECLVGDIMTRPAVACRPGDPIASAEATMKDNRVRRLPVIDSSGRLAGILSLNDLALASLASGRRQKDLAPEVIVTTLAAVCQHRTSVASA